ncbi:MAG: PorT family protein [Prevotella sp.]|jgi:opacity protein-like surface antigen|nr:PorT family protein [Prevotella sp.]MBR0274302.1 PorT family protein [Bacteroidaceae bacterium]MBR6195655.1 PorT family protein [Prevotella sp.]
MKRLITFIALVLPSLAFAQWRVGVNGGATYNHSTISKHYMTDYQWKDRWGVTLGVMGQYDVNDWLGVRAELDWTQKNYRLTRQILSNLDYKYVNNYLQLPVMASFSFGGKQLRGFCNAGVYGGYWLTSGREGTDFNNSSEKVYEFSEDIKFNSERDQRFDFGFVGGIGLEYRFCQRWAAQVEMRYYYSTVSTQKDYMRLSDPRYNSTLGVQAGLWYSF